MTDRIAFASPVVLEGRRLRGSVKLAGERTRRNNEWLEIDPAAIQAADATDIVGRWEHDPSRMLGRSSNGTVRFSANDEGIEYEIDLPDTSYANDLLELANRGDIRGSSFEIEGLKYAFSTDLEDGSRVRRITHINRITDVSPVTDPAFLNSSVAAFSKENEVSTPVAAEEPKAPEAPAAPAPEARATFTEPGADVAQFEAAARGLNNEQLAQVMDNIMADSKGDLEGEMLARYEAFAKVYGERTAVSAEEKDRASRMKALHDLRLGRIPKAPAQNGLIESDDYKAAFNKYLRGNTAVMEQFAQSISGDGSEGGYTVPDGFLNRITERMKKIGGIAEVAEEITTADGQSLRWPSNDDTGNSAAIAAEGVAGAAGADIDFGTVTLGAWSYSANGTGNVPLKVSWELLQDSAVDIEAFVGRKLGERIGRKQATDLATGGGTTLPFGLLSKTPDTVTATTTLAAAIEMEFHIDPAYRNDGNARWVMSDTSAVKFRQAVDLNGRPLWQSQAAAGMEGRPSNFLNGYPVTLDNGAGDLVAFGDIRLGYIVRRVRGIQVLVNPYSSSGTRQTEYHAWARMDANIQDAFAYSVGDFSTVTADAAVSG